MTMVQLFEKSAKENPTLICQMEKDIRGKFISYSYKDVEEKVYALSLSLKELGVKRGDRVGLISDNRAYWLIADLAIMSLGAADVPRGRDTMSQELSYILSEVESEVVFVENKEQLDKLLSIKEKLPHLKKIIIMEALPLTTLKELEERYDLFFYNEADLINKNINSDFSPVLKEIEKGNGDEIATIIFTSGTTGQPKGVMLTQNNFYGITRYIPSVHFPVAPGQRWLSVLPVWHSFERILQYVILDLSSTIVYSKPIGKIMLNDIKRTNPHWMGSVPRIWETVKSGVYTQMKSQKKVVKALFNFFIGVGMVHKRYHDLFFGLRKEYRKHSRVVDVIRSSIPLALLFPLYKLGYLLVYRKIHERLGSNFIAGISGGGSLPESTDRFFSAIGITLIDGYGLTETSPVIGLRSWKKQVSGTLTPFGDAEIKIVNEAGNICKSGEKGVLLVRGSQVMKGYYKHPELTKAVISPDGFLNTGDLAVRTIHGEFSIVGRAKDTIVLSGGENIEPVPIENMLTDSPYIQSAVVVGQDKKYLGALIVIDTSQVERYLKDAHIYYTDREELYSLPETEALVTNEIKNRVSKENGFRAFEQIVKFKILPNSFQVGRELSAKQEVKRFEVNKLYEKEIKSLF